jgi:hypothetical protein
LRNQTVQHSYTTAVSNEYIGNVCPYESGATGNQYMFIHRRMAGFFT